MTANKPTIPEVLDQFLDYHRRNPSWGELHCILDDGNVRDGFVTDVINNTEDTETEVLAGLLLRMSKTQRLKLSLVVQRKENTWIV